MPVNPTPTEILRLTSADDSSVSGIITNDSLTQSLTIEVSESWDGLTRWAPLDGLNATQFFEPIAPQESRHFQFDCSGLKNLRIRGTAAGAGLPVILAVQQTHAIGHR